MININKLRSKGRKLVADYQKVAQERAAAVSANISTITALGERNVELTDEMTESINVANVIGAMLDRVEPEASEVSY